MPKITQIIAREILDSRGTPTIETSVMTDIGVWGTASVPSGASVGLTEAVELRDCDKTRYNGKGVLKAVDIVTNKIAPALKGLDVFDQLKIDTTMLKMDGTPNKQNLGANSILSISIAVLKTAANAKKQPLFQYIHSTFAPKQALKIPTPTFNVINGGKHGAGFIDFQEFHILPHQNTPMHKSVRMASEITMNIKQDLHSRNLSTAVGDEGGFSPNLSNNQEAIDIITENIEKAGYTLGSDVYLGFDFAANNIHKGNHYEIKDRPKPLNDKELIKYYLDINKKYPVRYMEDPFIETAWRTWSEFLKQIEPNQMLVGDDLLTTNPKLLKKAIKNRSVNAILIKPNQIGTISETLQTISIAKQNNIKTIVSHRSGETNDTFIADFAVGITADFVKFGNVVRGERLAKYNRLLEIENYLIQTLRS